MVIVFVCVPNPRAFCNWIKIHLANTRTPQSWGEPVCKNQSIGKSRPISDSSPWGILSASSDDINNAFWHILGPHQPTTEASFSILLSRKFHDAMHLCIYVNGMKYECRLACVTFELLAKSIVVVRPGHLPLIVVAGRRPGALHQFSAFSARLSIQPQLKQRTCPTNGVTGTGILLGHGGRHF